MLLVLLFVYLLLVNAWVVDEAYITFRTADNLLHGYGLTWNTGERVQAFTHPLWMFLMALAARFTSEFYFTVIGVSLVLGLGVLAAAARFFGLASPDGASPGAAWRLPLFVLLLCCSKAYIDYATSGLENPLTHLLAALFFLVQARVADGPGAESERGVFWLSLIASLCAVNRLDTVLLFLPALAHAAVAGARRAGLRVVRAALIGGLPVTIWLAFSTIYYGFPFPNTYYAKLATSGVDFADRLRMGVAYLSNSLRWDPVTSAVLGVSALAAATRRHAAALSAVAGIGLYLGYVVIGAASATHMSGRFLSAPFLIAALVAVRMTGPGLGVALGSIALAFTLASDRSPARFGTSFHATATEAPHVIDTKLAVYQEGAALLNYGPNVSLPDHAWYKDGLRLRASSARVAVYSTPGYFGFAAGPEKWVIDQMGLCDPLLARIRGRLHPNHKGGHFVRALPDGYVQTVTMSRNLLADPSLGEYYEKLASITQGPLFTRERFSNIIAMNLGRYDHLLEAYSGN